MSATLRNANVNRWVFSYLWFIKWRDDPWNVRLIRAMFVGS